jgi:DNA-binding LacI/PurR family transcriptional regulator
METPLVRGKPLYRQLGTRLEEKILSGELAAGDQLPTTQALAAQFGVTVQTAQQAAAVLSERGLIERIPGRGTFVSRRILSRTIGIVFGSNVFAGAHYEFYQSVYGCLCLELKRLGWNTNLYFPVDENSQEQMLAELGQDAANDRLRGLIVLCRSEALRAWLQQHPGLVRAEDTMTSLTRDPHADETYRGIAYLLDRGYRRLAVVAHTETTEHDIVDRMQADIALAYAEHGLPMQATFHGGEAATHADGMAQARAILDGPDGAPEAFLVLNDQGAMGVIFELMRRKLDIPADIGVMALANKGIAIPCPVPLTRLEVDPADHACRMIEETLALIEGREPKPQPVESRLIAGESCGEKRSRRQVSWGGSAGSTGSTGGQETEKS